MKTVRVDFHGSAVVNAVDIVLRLRAALADSGNKFPAFDLGLAAWWAFASPGAPLPDLRSRRGFDVRAQITDTLNDILSDSRRTARYGAADRANGYEARRRGPLAAVTGPYAARLRAP